VKNALPFELKGVARVNAGGSQKDEGKNAHAEGRADSGMYIFFELARRIVRKVPRVNDKMGLKRRKD